MRYIYAFILSLLPATLTAQDWEDERFFGDPDAAVTLQIVSSTDTTFFAPIIDGFLAENPDTAIAYFVTGTADIDQIFRVDPKAFDLVISSAMDLQLKLANDGFAMRLSDIVHPQWAQWRQSVFAFTREPAAIVLNKAAFAGHPIPKTRQDVITALRDRPEVFRGRLGTYDVRQSGVGYLFATQDGRVSETYWRLMEVMGGLNARLYCCSGQMIDDLMTGKIAMAYNVLGSYAAARADASDRIEIILPSDFPTTMMRTVLVSGQTREPDRAAAFVAYLLDPQSPGRVQSALPALAPGDDSGRAATIALGPALMTYLDDLKRRTFIEEWENAMIQ
ncbi:extracellular solute-binding protein [Yoonia sp. SS1-5]|uniref:ABC transporter substrate-binding protein n=1 Tax=Yoonia rhodophyticola TaxID=3137370 RepID=A0AAN0NLV2_9RHOB